LVQDLRAELHFYGKKLDRLGIVYYKTPKIPVKCPDILFFSLYALKLFTSKKLSPPALTRIRQRLSLGEDLKKVFEREEDRPFDAPMALCEYSMITKSVFRSQILFRGGDKFSFILGSSGFGFFGNRKHFDHCAEGSIFGLMEKFYRMFKEDPAMLTALFAAAVLLGKAEFNADGGHSLPDMARKIYLRATEEYTV